MILKLNNIDVDCIIGDRPEERIRTQHLRIDVVLTVCDRAAESDQLGDTVDYAVLTEKIREALMLAKCRMIERAARIVAEACLTDDKVSHVTASVTKTGAIAHLKSASAIYEMERK